jgi:hypothetical protein
LAEAERQGGREAGRQRGGREAGRQRGGREAGRQGGREEGERQRGREAGRQRGREAERRERGREAERQRGRETERQGGREAERRERGREAERQRQVDLRVFEEIQVYEASSRTASNKQPNPNQSRNKKSDKTGLGMCLEARAFQKHLQCKEEEEKRSVSQWMELW